MPIFEYHCLDCRKPFERIRAANERDTALPCPVCGSTRTRRAISVFATLRPENSNRSLPVSTGSSGGGGCACGGNCGCH